MKFLINVFIAYIIIMIIFYISYCFVFSTLDVSKFTIGSKSWAVFLSMILGLGIGIKNED